MRDRLTLSVQDGKLCVALACEHCTRCVLPATFPDISFDSSGVCSFCRAEAAMLVEQNFTEVERRLRRAPDTRPYDCVMLYSGGKDSSMALYTARRRLGWRVLAVTLDNGFTAPVTFENITRVVGHLGIDHLTVKPQEQMMLNLYRLSLREPFTADTTRYSTSACGSCISLVLATGARVALERGVPLLAGGWTPGQFTNDAIVPGEFLQEVCGRHFAPLSAMSDCLRSELKEVVPTDGAWPALVNVLYFERYNETEIIATLEAIGWRRPADTDSCSTNCSLNSYLVVDHLLKYGYHPYVYELAHHVRRGFLSRAEAFERLNHLQVAPEALERIGQMLQRPISLGSVVVSQ